MKQHKAEPETKPSKRRSRKGRGTGDYVTNKINHMNRMGIQTDGDRATARPKWKADADALKARKRT